jgi:hypothetical protein
MMIFIKKIRKGSSTPPSAIFFFMLQSHCHVLAATLRNVAERGYSVSKRGTKRAYNETQRKMKIVIVYIFKIHLRCSTTYYNVA